MEGLAAIVATGAVMLIVGLLLRELESKVKIIYWVPHSFFYKIQTSTSSQPVLLFTHAFTIQNIGRRRAEYIEIYHETKPDFFKLQPALNYEENITPSGEYVVKVKALGAKEHFTIEFLSYLSLSKLLFIRSEVGHATQIQIRPQRVLPQWTVWLSNLALITGSAFITYWILRIIIFILKGSGVIDDSGVV